MLTSEWFARLFVDVLAHNTFQGYWQAQKMFMLTSSDKVVPPGALEMMAAAPFRHMVRETQAPASLDDRV